MTTIICRCEDVTEADILEAIGDGCRTLDELKYRLRLGMGPCQGRTCLALAARILARETGQSIEELAWQTARPLVVPVSLGTLEGEPHD
ncbi:MAG: (2Fe-2S)-binding protein [Thermoplasmatota archaeon]